jgi:hypothetical protein
VKEKQKLCQRYSGLYRHFEFCLRTIRCDPLIRARRAFPTIELHE